MEGGERGEIRRRSLRKAKPVIGLACMWRERETQNYLEVWQGLVHTVTYFNPYASVFTETTR